MRINYYKTKMVLVKENGMNYKVDDDFQVTDPEKIAKLIYDVFELQGEMQEHLIVICLDTKNKIIAVKTAFVGSLNKSVVHPREIFNFALLSSSASIIVAHNHPSGDVRPSQQDISVTKRLSEVGELIGIELLDHIIIGNQYDELDVKYLSMREEKYLS
jgi:DNA repair protein RadC